MMLLWKDEKTKYNKEIAIVISYKNLWKLKKYVLKIKFVFENPLHIKYKKYGEV